MNSRSMFWLCRMASTVTCLTSGAPALGAENLLLKHPRLSEWELVAPVNALGPIEPNGTWTDERGAIVAAGMAAPWTVQTAGDPSWSDYRLSASVTVHRATPALAGRVYHADWDRYLPREMFPPMCQHTGQYRYRYFAGEFDWGSDAAVHVRYAGRWDCYRVQLSTRYQELILWHGLGGYLQVVPCETEGPLCPDARHPLQRDRDRPDRR